MPSKAPQVSVSFRSDLALSIVVDLSFVALAPEHEGFDQWVYSTSAALSADLRDDIHILYKPLGNKLLLDELIRAGESIEEIPAFVRFIGGLSPEAVRASNQYCLEALGEAAGLIPASEDLLDDPSALRSRLDALADRDLIRPTRLDELARLLAHPEELKAMLIHLVTRFWDRHVRSDRPACAALEKRSIANLSARSFTGSPSEIIAEISGRPIPDAHRGIIESARRLVFVPSCHTGPYVSVDPLGDEAEKMVVIYNCRPTSGTDDETTLPIGELFPPLKALADETRLQILSILNGKELYAQQIVDRMDVSQSAVSRHLRLLVAAGVLHERRHEGMKFYRINEETIAATLAHLRLLRETESDT